MFSFSKFFLLQGYDDGLTLIADNPFISKKELVPFEKGIRIDYILFKVGESWTCCIFIPSCSQEDVWVIRSICICFSLFLIPRVLPKRTFIVISCAPPKAPSLAIHSHTPTMRLWLPNLGWRHKLWLGPEVAANQRIRTPLQVFLPAITSSVLRGDLSAHQFEIERQLWMG